MPKSSAYPDLERVPGKQNWVDHAGGLPSYIERIAKHIHYEGGKPIGSAIAMAVSTVKKWCATGRNHNGGKLGGAAQAKACKAVASWEAKKGKSKAKDLKEARYPGGICPDCGEKVKKGKKHTCKGLSEAALVESLVRETRERLMNVEGTKLLLSGSPHGKSNAVEAAKALLEGKQDGPVRVSLGGKFVQPTELAEVRADLRREATECRALLESLGATVEKPKTNKRGSERNPPLPKDKAKVQAVPKEKVPPIHLRRGSAGERVIHLQNRLRKLGYDVKSDGVMGEYTESALRSFQSHHGVKPDGIVGPKTTTILRTTNPEESQRRRDLALKDMQREQELAMGIQHPGIGAGAGAGAGAGGSASVSGPQAVPAQGASPATVQGGNTDASSPPGGQSRDDAGGSHAGKPRSESGGQGAKKTATSSKKATGGGPNIEVKLSDGTHLKIGGASSGGSAGGSSGASGAAVQEASLRGVGRRLGRALSPDEQRQREEAAEASGRKRKGKGKKKVRVRIRSQRELQVDAHTARKDVPGKRLDDPDEHMDRDPDTGKPTGKFPRRSPGDKQPRKVKPVPSRSPGVEKLPPHPQNPNVLKQKRLKDGEEPSQEQYERQGPTEKPDKRRITRKEEDAATARADELDPTSDPTKALNTDTSKDRPSRESPGDRDAEYEKLSDEELDAMERRGSEKARDHEDDPYTEMRDRARREKARRKKKVEEAATARAASAAKRTIKRLDDGTFAPKGLGRVLRPKNKAEGRKLRIKVRRSPGAVIHDKPSPGAVRSANTLARDLSPPKKVRIRGLDASTKKKADALIKKRDSMTRKSPGDSRYIGGTAPLFVDDEATYKGKKVRVIARDISFPEQEYWVVEVDDPDTDHMVARKDLAPLGTPGARGRARRQSPGDDLDAQIDHATKKYQKWLGIADGLAEKTSLAGREEEEEAHEIAQDWLRKLNDLKAKKGPALGPEAGSPQAFIRGPRSRAGGQRRSPGDLPPISSLADDAHPDQGFMVDDFVRLIEPDRKSASELRGRLVRYSEANDEFEVAMEDGSTEIANTDWMVRVKTPREFGGRQSPGDADTMQALDDKVAELLDEYGSNIESWEISGQGDEWLIIDIKTSDGLTERFQVNANGATQKLGIENESGQDVSADVTADLAAELEKQGNGGGPKKTIDPSEGPGWEPSIAAAPKKKKKGRVYLELKPGESVSADEVGSLSGKYVVVTGKIDGITRKQIEADVMNAGGEIVNIDAKKTPPDLLIVGQKAGSKLAKARDRGIPIMSYDEAELLLEAAGFEGATVAFAYALGEELALLEALEVRDGE